MMTPNKSLHALAENLVLDAYLDCDNWIRVNRAVKEGRQLPERARPGRIIMNKPPEVREQIKLLRAEHFQHRIK
jgi:hypothetical protein